jgi:hypothetical protein
MKLYAGIFALVFVCSTMTAQTIAYYHFDETAGLIASALIDSGPSNLTGTVQGSAVFAPGVLGNCLDLSGDLNYGQIPNSANMTLTNDWTIEFFFKANLPFHIYGFPGVMVNKLFTPNVGNFLSSYVCLFADTGQVVGQISFSESSGVDLVSPSQVNFADGNWHHYALTCKIGQPSTTFSLFVDYSLVDSVTNSFPPIVWANYPVYVGAGNFPNGQDNGQFRRNFDGQIDELRFSKTALLPSQFIAVPSTNVTTDIVAIPGAVKLSASTQTNHVYQLQSRTNLSSGNWSNLYGILPGNGSFFYVTNLFVPGVNQQFFRVLTSQ